MPTLQVFPVPGYGPEDVLVDRDGSVLTGLADGRIIRLDPATSAVAVVADTGGRPLGLEWLPDGRLLICDATLGLLVAEIDRDRELDPRNSPSTGAGRVETLVDRVDDVPVRICNNAAVEPDGTIWFTDSSARFDFAYWKADIIEHRGSGRLIRRTPDGDTQTVVSGLNFANGVALAPDSSAVYVAETGSYSIERISLRGRHIGKRDTMVDNLPGFPDNLSIGTDGLLWVALASPRVRAADALAPRAPWLRRAVWRMPDRLQPQPDPKAAVMAFDHEGIAVQDIRGFHPEFGTSTGVREHHGDVWLGSLTFGAVARFAVRDVEI